MANPLGSSYMLISQSFHHLAPPKDILFMPGSQTFLLIPGIAMINLVVELLLVGFLSYVNVTAQVFTL